MHGFSLRGRNIVLTGSNRGIGLSLLKELLDRGNRILAVDIDTDVLETIGHPDVHILKCDVSTREGVDRMFSEAIGLFGRIDAIIANAGIPYYEIVSKADWERMIRIFSVNVFSPIYAYERMIEHLDGSEGLFAVTCSAMGEVPMPGFALYSSTKHAVDGFFEAIKYERPKNLHVCASYPVSTDTGFFKVASRVEMEKPFPVQRPEHVAKNMISGIEKGKRKMYPSKLFRFASVLFRVVPPVKWGYMHHYRRNLFRHQH